MFESPYGPAFSPLDAEQQTRLIGLIQHHGLESLQDQILSMAQSSIVLEAVVEEPLTIGCSRLGGLPDVLPGWTWPEGLLFLGQFNMEEIRPCNPNNLLPERGLLSFFHYHEQMDSHSVGLPYRIDFFEDLSNLQQAPAPPRYLPVAYNNEQCVFTPVRVAPRNTISLPPTYSHGWRQLVEIDESSDIDEAISELQQALHVGGWQRGHQLLGYPAFMDGDANEEAWQATNNVSIRLMGKEISAEERDSTLSGLENAI